MLRNMTFFIPLLWGIVSATQIIEVSGADTEFKMQQINPSILNVRITTGDIVTYTEITDDMETSNEMFHQKLMLLK